VSYRIDLDLRKIRIFFTKGLDFDLVDARLICPSGSRGMEIVGWAKARLRRAHHSVASLGWWARFALPTLRDSHLRQ